MVEQATSRLAEHVELFSNVEGIEGMYNMIATNNTCHRNSESRLGSSRGPVYLPTSG